MRRLIRGLAAVALALAAVACATPERPVREIALTYDDIPLTDGPIYTGAERSERLIVQLREAGVTQAMFFANAGRDPAAVQSRLRAYAAAGHAIANHTATHPNLRDLSVEAYVAEIAAADAVLRPLPGWTPYFRYPYLSEGDTVEKRDAVRQALVAMGLRQGYVTADSYDWRLDTHMRAALSSGNRLDMDELRDLYVSTAVEAAEYNDRMAQAVLGRSPRQVMLLHENDLAALFTVDLVRALERKGWRIVPATVAFEDPIATMEPDTLSLGGGRIRGLWVAQGGEAVFNEERGSYDSVDAPFDERVVIRP